MSEQLPDRCPLCGGPNDCGGAACKSECWCSSVPISREALARVPEEARGKVCVCRACGEMKEVEPI
jgi:Cysteine-rich CWC